MTNTSMKVEFWGADVVICSHCGHLCESDSRPLRRREGRVRVHKKCTIAYKKNQPPIAAVIEDASLEGAKVKYKAPPFREASRLFLHVSALRIPVTVMWSHSPSEDCSYSGLQLVWPLGKTSLLSVAVESLLEHGITCQCSRHPQEPA
ncbi:MAG: PilZ domain-containing protein [Deltaproteobacteria bacterium]|nr:PilZ domain-containing protein [Deltaproteobacteria bacterium]